MNCLGCNKEAKSTKGWCSLTCYRTNQQLAINRKKTGPKEQKVKRVCSCCKETFYTTQSRTANGKAIYCSRKCLYSVQDKRVTLTCKNCGKNYRCKKSVVKVSKFCCRRCCTIHTLKTMPNKETSIEVKVREFLTEANLPFKAQEGIANITVADFVVGNNVIFCDGDYWHGTKLRQFRDRRINGRLEKLGYNVLRFWEHDIHKKFNEVKERIRYACC